MALCVFLAASPRRNVVLCVCVCVCVRERERERERERPRRVNREQLLLTYGVQIYETLVILLIVP